MKKFGSVGSYVLVALLTALATVFAVKQTGYSGSQKLNQLLSLIDERFIEDVDTAELEDAAAEAMIKATGDQWSYYIPASEYPAHVERSENAYVGVGITIVVSEDPAGLEIVGISDGGGAQEAGLQLHDVLIEIDGQSCAEMSVSDAGDLVRGEEGTTMDFTVSRDGEQMKFTVTRKRMETPVATYEMLSSGYGLITIENFESRATTETVSAIETLMEQGAKGLIFDLRFNPGGYKKELVQILDYLLPEGILFRSEFYDGTVEVDRSDANCVDIPMAVLVNQDSYSAAEFFAAALQEYGVAQVVGQQTSGKGYFQSTFRLQDGSAAAISVGKYYTPNGVSLAGVGVTPDIPVEVDDKTYGAIYFGILEPEEDEQLQAAVAALEEGA